MASIARGRYLVQIGDFFVEMGESGFEGLAMARMSGGVEIVGNPNAG